MPGRIARAVYAVKLEMHNADPIDIFKAPPGRASGQGHGTREDRHDERGFGMAFEDTVSQI